MKRQVTINGRFLSRRMTGVDRFAVEVVRAIDRLLAEDDPDLGDMAFDIVVPPGTEAPPAFERIGVRTAGSLRGQLWEQFDLPRRIPRQSLLLSLCNTSPAFVRRQVAVIHDAGTRRVPTAYKRAFRSWYGLLMPVLGAVSRRIVTVSRFSEGEISEAFAIARTKIDVVSEGGEHILRVARSPDAVAKFGLGARPYVLAVSSMAAHKNFGLVMEAVAQLPEAGFDIAIAGGANPDVFGQAGIAGASRIRWLGYVSDSELRTLYESALCFVFPSIYEGFGIPPLEAMHCGCPVLAADAASIPEVCGDAALYFDPRDAVGLGKLMLRVADDPDLRTRMAARGRLRAMTFSWERAARQLVAVCRSAMR